MPDMREWNELVAKIAAEPTPDHALRALLHAIADKIEEFDFDNDDDVATDELRAIFDELADVAWALRAKTEAFIDAILHKPRPGVIELPDQSGED